jgi:hypothetical protein
VLGDLFYQLGHTLGGLDARLQGKAGAASGSAAGRIDVDDAESGDREAETEPEEVLEHALIGAAGTWLATRLLRPKPVSWPRVVLAGIAATALADLIGRTFDDETTPGRKPYAATPEEMLARFGAGVAIAAGYAALLYPRIPGSPLFRGLTFGALEIAAAPRGGLVRMASAAPGLRYPLQALATPIDEDAGPLAHLAFGLGLGLFYRNGGRDPSEESET